MQYDHIAERLIPAFCGLVSIIASLYLLFQPIYISQSQYVLIGASSIIIGILCVRGLRSFWPAVLALVGFGFYMLAQASGLHTVEFVRFSLGLSIFILGFVLLMRAFTPSTPQ
jgi:uncharacterized membrane protein HdeD (DUF308 family)